MNGMGYIANGKWHIRVASFRAAETVSMPASSRLARPGLQRISNDQHQVRFCIEAKSICGCPSRDSQTTVTLGNKYQGILKAMQNHPDIIDVY